MEKLVEISRYYGQNKEYIIAGGGNTSVKDSDRLMIKASGFSLENIDQDGFVPLDRKKLALITSKTYSQDPLQREQQVKEDLLNSRIDSELRPSVESSLHDLIEYKYVVHTHPTFINALLCSKEVETQVKNLFPEEYLYVKYVDPGYILFKYVEEEIAKYEGRFNKQPQVILMQNHGVFVGAETIEEIKNIYEQIERKVKMMLDMLMPATSENLSALNKLTKLLQQTEAYREQVILPHYHPLMENYLSDRSCFNQVNGPFIPDHIVYCKAYPLFLDLEESELNKNKIEMAIADHLEKYGYEPKIIYLKGAGAVAIDQKESGARIIKDLIDDILLICHHAQSFGGPRFLTGQDIQFIESWEVENYRKKIADKV